MGIRVHACTPKIVQTRTQLKKLPTPPFLAPSLARSFRSSPLLSPSSLRGRKRRASSWSRFTSQSVVFARYQDNTAREANAVVRRRRKRREEEEEEEEEKERESAA